MEGAMCRLPRVFVKTPHVSQFYPKKMSTSIYINFTPQRRVRQHRIVSLQKCLFTLLLRDLFTVNIWLCLIKFNKQSAVPHDLWDLDADTQCYV